MIQQDKTLKILSCILFINGRLVILRPKKKAPEGA